MFSKNEIRRGDKICFRDTKFLKVIEVTDKYITVEKDQFTKKSVKRDDFRIVKINSASTVSFIADSYYAFIPDCCLFLNQGDIEP